MFGAFVKIGRSKSIIIFAVLIAVIIAASVSITQYNISDTDPSTYVIIPMLMLPVFAIFMLKDKSILPNVDRNDMLIGAVLFAAFILLEMNSFASFGGAFFSYRIDMLLLPIAIIALAIMLFGMKNLDKFAPIAIYSVFASPVLLLPIIEMNLGFASANTFAIYLASKLVFHGISFSSPITLYFNNSGISIGNACIGIGAIIGLVVFLIPVAYFLKGRIFRKIVWILSALALLLVLNFVRMLLISIDWFLYGPNSTISQLHSFIGQLMFYGIIVVMLLAVGRYGMEYPAIKLDEGKMPRKQRYGNVVIAVVFTAFYFFLSLSYIGASYVSPQYLSNNPVFNWDSASSLFGAHALYKGPSYSLINSQNTSIDIVLQNATNNGVPIEIIFAKQNASIENFISYNKSIIAWKEYLGTYGTSFVYEYGVPNTKMFVYYAKVPYSSGGTSYILDMYVVAPMLNGYGTKNCINPYESAYGAFANIARLNPNAFNSTLDNEYCQIMGLVH